MKRILVVSLAMVVLIVAGQAAAAEDNPAATALFNWSGFHAGINVGGSRSLTSGDYNLGGSKITNNSFRSNSFIGGGQVGYNYQINPIVLGMEFDIAGRHATADKTFAFDNGVDFTRFHTEQNWVGTLRPRLGFALDNFLIYGTPGLAFGNIKHKYSENRPSLPAGREVSDSTTRVGWTIGTGVDYGFYRHWSAGFEYLYMDFGHSKLLFPAQTINGLPFPISSTSFDDRSHVFRVKLNYRFN